VAVSRSAHGLLATVAGAYKALFEDAGLEHVSSWHGNLAPIDPCGLVERGPQVVTDTIAVARKPIIALLGSAALGTLRAAILYASSGVRAMPAIRIPDEHWGKVWRTLVASGPVGCVGPDRIYLVSDRQLRLLRRKKLPFEQVSAPNGRNAARNHG
jgi:hypothetical protein